MKKVSIALAAYRGEKFIAEQIKSLLAQTMPPDEIIICDDSPDDLTSEQIKPYLACGKINYIHNPVQLGICRNFEKALSLCSGEYIFLCDQDDFWLPDKIETLVNVLECNPQYSGAFCDSTVVNKDLKPLGFSLWEMRSFTKNMQKELNRGCSLKVFLKRVTLSSHNIVFRKECLPRILPFPELGIFYPDTWIGLQLAISGNWYAVNKQLTLYRVHDNNCSSPTKPNWKTQMKFSAKARQRDAFGCTLALAQELIGRAPADTPENYLKMLRNYSRHYLNRKNFSKNFFCTIFQIFCEYLSGRYHTCSNGIKSVAADILL